MIYMIRRLMCDFCRQDCYEDETESDDEHYESAAEQGWSRVAVKNGSTWDCCPNCRKDVHKSANTSPFDLSEDQ